MPANYLDTPATERGDVSLAQVPALDFSIVQPFASPTKNPAEDLRNKMRGLRGRAMQQPPMRTPRIRNALLSKPNPAGPSKQEFTPLLRSARRKELLRQSIMEEKENSDVPPTPAGFRSSYGGDGTQLPLNSSMLDDEGTRSSMGGPAPVAHAISSSMLSATPVPSLPKDGQGGVLEGNVLSLRDQEAKLDQIQKENFGLKLKIHFLEEALRKTGSEYHQATLKENAELKTERLTIDADSKRQKKRLLMLEQELEEYRHKHSEHLQTSKKFSATSEGYAEELAKLQKLADAAQQLADDRLRDMERLRAQLEEVQKSEEPAEQIQELQDDIQDLKGELRERENQLDTKDEQIDSLQAELRTAKAGSEEIEHMQQDIDELEAELKEKEEELTRKDHRISELEQNTGDDDDSKATITKLKSDLAHVEKELHHKTEVVDNAVKHIGELKERLQTSDSENKKTIAEHEREIEALEDKLEGLESQQAITSKQHGDALRNAERELADKEGEIRALQERLGTARGSWDAEAQQTDARLQEKDRQLKERDERLREKIQVIEQRDDELADLQRRLRTADLREKDAVQSQTSKFKSLTDRVFELEHKLQRETAKASEISLEKDKVIESQSAELRSERNRVKLTDGAEVRTQTARLHELESANKRAEASNREQARRITSLESQLNAVETPSRKNALLKEQSSEVLSLKQKLQKLEESKDAELDELEQELESLEKENLSLQQKVGLVTELEIKVETLSIERDGLQRRIERLDERARTAEKDQSILGHQTDELGEKQAKIEKLEDEMDKLEVECQRHEHQMRLEIEQLRAQHDVDLATTKQALEDDIVMLENALDEADAEKSVSTARILKLEQDVQAAKLAKETGTPARERDALRARLERVEAERDDMKSRLSELEIATKDHANLRNKLASAEGKAGKLHERIAELEGALETAQQEKTIADERQDLHSLVKQSRIEAEEIQLKLDERERKLSASSKREGEVRGQLEAAQLELEDLQAHTADLEGKMASQVAREKHLRAQVRELKEAAVRLDELEMQLGDRNSSSSGHARREAELRSQLRDAKIGLESLQIELAEKEDRILTLMKREHALRQQVQRGRTVDDDATQIMLEDVQAQLEEAEGDVKVLQRQLVEREKLLNSSQKKEVELRSRIKGLQSLQHAVDGDADQRRHLREVKGLAKQIQLLRARCAREEGFRQDLVYTKRWFLMQVEMYNECNQADLRLLEEMGITPDQTFRQRKPSLRTLGLTVLATIRMQKMSAAWAENKRTQETLVKKLESMKKAKAKAMK
ncbi:hypothetical protein AMS68_006117 [Peltaster fructicola]|uniref:Centrosomin N-terminal motif 1 domain-containing protein n=1 Tax=Peltaster fructicola TaxID=286661 RepID=A0A6H0Y1S3_9PEZI|nr:hypothetical protein AMS68_006117 [Peltaster fructicola]